MQTAIKGRLTMEAAASPGLFTNIIATTAQMVIKSGIRVVTQLDSTSFRELMSPIIRARIFPVGRLSKNWKSRVWIWVYSSWRMVTRMLLHTFAITYIRSLIPRTIIRFRTMANRISRPSPVKFPAVI